MGRLNGLLSMATTPKQQLLFTDVFAPKPKQRQLFDAIWQGALTGDPEYLLWGGSAGPGKSWGLRVAAVVFLIKCFATLKLRGVQVGLFSVDFPRLRDRHMNEIKHWPDWLGSYNETTHDFTLGKQWGDGILSLRNLDDPSKYSSAQFAAEFIEELTEIDRATFEELRTRKRWPGVPYSPVVAVTNPRLKGLVWVRKLWIEHDFSGGDANLTGHNFWFLQALPSDNDSLPSSYYDTLGSLGPSLRKQLLEGDWYVSIDQAFPDFARWKRDAHGELVRTEDGELIPWHQIPVSELNPTWRRIAGHDWGYDSPGHHVWAAVDPVGGVIVYREWVFRHLDAQDIVAGIQYRQGDERLEATYADPSIWNESKAVLSHEQVAILAQSGKLQLSKYQQYSEAGLSGLVRGINARVAGVNRIHTLLKDRGDGVPYLRIMDNCPVLLGTLQNLTKDPDNGEDVLTDYLPDDDLRDDSYDALRYLLMGVPTKAVNPTPVASNGSWGFSRR